MTQRGDQMRVSLYGCSHKPKVSAMVSPKRGDSYFCSICRRERKVLGAVTAWADAVLECRNCPWVFRNEGRFGGKRLTGIALRHSDTRMHVVHVVKGADLAVIKPQRYDQLFLVDDLLLP